MEIQQHISQQYNQDLKSIKSKVISMGSLVELQVKNAIYALLNQDKELVKEVSMSDYKINKMEMKIDADCAKVFTKRQLAAGDLRLVIAVVKIITDLERMGDEAEKIGLKGSGSRNACRAF
ncbi:PhoU domain-containing protein [Abyssogena phaseoliformis symbiont]|uniref:PhoU domain-containing protein n=1 Tax=Abyssogena phaseoliformis symbiont TaxID=596095 RepID=UPI00191569CB|nr:PhoU domain-containing protein [Abyssogena phaseoliformis symbiont]